MKVSFDGLDGILEGKGKIGIVIAHGRNNTMALPMLKDLAKALSKSFTVLRFNYDMSDDYLELARQQISAIDYLKDSCEKIILVGKSMGGMLSLYAATKRHVKAVVVLGFPIREITEEYAFLLNVKCPIFIVQGDKDAYALPEYVAPSAKQMGAEMVVIKGDHSYKGNEKKAVQLVVDWLKRFK